jgi:hypothetical protein
MELRKIGRVRNGTEWAMIMKAPATMPEPPSPATARPMIKAVLVGASAHTRDPSSKMAMAKRKVYLMEK